MFGPRAKDVAHTIVHDPAERFGAETIQFEIDLDDPKVCEATFDFVNTVKHDEFGDMTSTTYRHVNPKTITLTKVKATDSLGTGRRVFELDYQDSGRSRLHIVVPKAGTNKGKLRLLRVAVGSPSQILDGIDLDFA